MPGTTQPTPETDEKKSLGFGTYVVWVFVAVVLYLLSTGPAARFEIKTGGAHPVLDVIYAPIGWLNDNTPLRKPLGMYWHIWCPDYFDKNGDSKN
jgi:hypothetical protein